MRNADFSAAAVLVALTAIGSSATGVNAQVPLATGYVSVLDTAEDGQSANLGLGGESINFPGVLTGTACSSVAGGGCETSSGYAFSALSISASGSSGSELAVSEAQSEIMFYYEVLGPTNEVELDFSAALTTSAEGDDANGQAQIDGSYGLPGVAACSTTQPKALGVCYGEKANANASFATYTVPTYAVAYVLMSAEGDSSFTGSGTGGWSASVDPIITIDPTFLKNNPGDYSLVFSSNVHPAAAIPEPSTWAMMLIGFAGLAVVGSIGLARLS